MSPPPLRLTIETLGVRSGWSIESSVKVHGGSDYSTRMSALVHPAAELASGNVTAACSRTAWVALSGVLCGDVASDGM